MLYKRKNPISIDTEIQYIQEALYDSLVLTWVNKLNGYGRIYKDVEDESGILKPYWYDGGKEYKEVYFDDKFAGNFFFIDDDDHQTEDSFVFTSIVKCVFMVDLSQILASETDRADSIAQRDVVQILRQLSMGKFEITGIEKGLRNVFSELDFSGVNFLDLHPKHCFSVSIKLSYHLNQECNVLWQSN